MESEIKPLFELKYNISKFDYKEYNKLLLEDVIKAKSKKSIITGLIMIIMSVVLAAQIIMSKRYNEYILDFLILFVFCMGIYTFMFYKKIFPKHLEKYSDKAFLITKFSKGDITLRFFKDYLIELSYNGEEKINYNLITQKHENDKLLVFLGDNKQMVIIKKQDIREDLLQFIKKEIEIKKP